MALTFLFPCCFPTSYVLKISTSGTHRSLRMQTFDGELLTPVVTRKHISSSDVAKTQKRDGLEDPPG